MSSLDLGLADLVPGAPINNLMYCLVLVCALSLSLRKRHLGIRQTGKAVRTWMDQRQKWQLKKVTFTCSILEKKMPVHVVVPFRARCLVWSLEMWTWFADRDLVSTGTVSGCCIATESDPELEVEYREKLEHEFPDSDSLSDSNTVNQDDDSFSVLGGDSLNEQEFLEQEMPPLFVHLTCSVKLRSQHSSMPVQSLPTCLGRSNSCWEVKWQEGFCQVPAG